MLIIGIDAATWDIIKPNIDFLPNFKKLMKEEDHQSCPETLVALSMVFYVLRQNTRGAWHHDFVKDGEIVTRDGIKVDFIWDALDGVARNLPDGRMEVLLEGDKETIQGLYEDLKKETPELAKNPALSKIDFDIDMTIPAAMRSSQALILGQLGKGVVVLDDMNKKLDTLPARIAGALKNILQK